MEPMRRLLVLLVSSCLAVLGLAMVGLPSAQAAGSLTGRLVSSANTTLPVVGATVRLRRVTATGPGTVVATDVSDSNGNFALNAGPSPEDEYYVQMLTNAYQGGYVGGAPGDVNYIQTNVGNASTYGPSATLGKVLALPGFIKGVVVNAATSQPVRGVAVTARSANDISQVEGFDTTDRLGRFAITGLQCEDDCYLRLNGSGSGYETGFRACGGGVVPTWPAACASPIGYIGKVRLDHL
jgi:hypothetical protein